MNVSTKFPEGKKNSQNFHYPIWASNFENPLARTQNPVATG